MILIQTERLRVNYFKISVLTQKISEKIKINENTFLRFRS